MATIASVTILPEHLQITLEDGRVLGVPWDWFPRLQSASPLERSQVTIGGHGMSLHWPELDEDLSLANLLAGGDPTSA